MAGSSVLRVGEPAQDGEAAADGVGARAEPLVRQRLPAREQRDAVAVEQAAERGDQVLGLAAGRGDGEHGAALPDEAGDDERAQAGGRGQVERRRLGRGERLAQRRVVEDDVEQAGERHG